MDTKNNFQAIFLLGSLFFQIKNYNEAVKMLAKALSMQPKNINVYQNLVTTLVEIYQIISNFITVVLVKIFVKQNTC